ncbi:hypothetical protein [Kutzneria sp. NPDC051319]|uniref:hypothetical protein n=1 Tax=Kutzneria sp. NPDC051319 TaxID=3155047 RepID=UPI0034197836
MSIPDENLFRRRARTQPRDATGLPASLVDPRTPATVLIAEAEARGAADGRRHERDSWSFGGPADEVSEQFDPSYVVGLRWRCEAAVDSVIERHEMTESRTEHLRRVSAEASGFMTAARSMMNRLAVRAHEGREPLDGEAEPAQPDDMDDEDPVWEGETTTLALRWRLLVLAGLFVVAVFLIHYAMSGLLAGRTSEVLVLAVSVAAAAILVTAPHLAALLLRARQATGTERRLAAAALALAVAWLVLVAILAFVCGAVLDDRSLRQLHLTSTTVVLMFVGLLVVVGVMAFMLGLARRHPFQEAYARQRQRRDDAEALRQEMLDRISPEHAEPREDGAVAMEAHVRAVRASYAAAEEAYFAALISVVADPSFTEAVQHRRGLRRPAAGAQS